MKLEDLKNGWKGQSVFLIGSGPSFRDVDKSLLQQSGIMTMTLNNAMASFRSNLWCCVDPADSFLGSIWSDPTVLKFIHVKARIDVDVSRRDGETYKLPVGKFPGIVRYRGNTEFNAETYLSEDGVSYGCKDDQNGSRSVLLAAIKVLYTLGFRRIYLLGVDFSMTKEDAYHFEEDRTDQLVKANNAAYTKLKKRFAQLKPEFEEAGLQVINCNPDSKLRTFPFVTLEQAVTDALNPVPIPSKEQTKGMYERSMKRYLTRKQQEERTRPA